MTLAELLADCGVRTALIVDDVYDLVPRADDIDPNNEAWSIISTDLSPAHHSRIAEVYPPADTKSFDDLVADDLYVKALWQLCEEFGDAVAPLFQVYISDQATDNQYVQLIRERLEGLGLIVRTAGRDFAANVVDVDLILVDLFFGKAQNPAALNDSKKRLKFALQSRTATPPLVILMSRSPRLEYKRDEFRDEVGLLDSAFRILMKSDLEKDGFLELQLARLAQHSAASRKLALFFHALETGVTRAATRTLLLFRKLRLSDIGQIQQLLLSFEGEPVGSYFVDVFDRVLQHEIERETGIIEAANGLNEFSMDKYPPPYVAGSPDLQELVQRLVTQNENRLGLPGAIDGNVAFGDVLRMQINSTEQQKQPLLSGLTLDNVLLVLTPACDLLRGGAPRILLLVGTIKPLTAKDWTYGSDARTPAVRIDGTLCWVAWELKHIDTVSREQLGQAFDDGGIRTVARLRESHALELQQRVLSHLGRVGQIAALPGSFLIDLEVYYAGQDGRPTRLDIDALAEGAVCFVGRDNDRKPVSILVLTEKCCDGVHAALTSLREDQVAQNARKAFRHVQTTSDLRSIMARGLNLKGIKDDKWKEITSETGTNSGVPQMGLIARNFTAWDQPLGGNLHKAGVLFIIRDVGNDDNSSLEDAICLSLDVPPESPQKDTEVDRKALPREANVSCACPERPTKPA